MVFKNKKPSSLFNQDTHVKYMEQFIPLYNTGSILLFYYYFNTMLSELNMQQLLHIININIFLGSSTRPIFRTSSLKTSHELISPSSQSSAASMHSAASYNKAKEFRFDELDEDGSHSDEDEEEDDNDNGSWI